MFAMAALIALGFLAAHGWWLLVPIGLVLLSWLSSRGAVAAAIAYGEGIRTGIDLHLFELLKALHLPLPATIQEERELNRRLSRFLLQGWPDDFVYKHH